MKSYIYLLACNIFFSLPEMKGQSNSFYLDTNSYQQIAASVFSSDAIYLLHGTDLIKTDYSGAVKWNLSNQVLNNRGLTVNGRLIIGNYIDSLVMLDTSGQLLWMKKFSAPVRPAAQEDNEFGSFAFDGTKIFLQEVQGASVYHKYPAVITLDTLGNILQVACDSITAGPVMIPCFAFPSIRKGAWFGYSGSGISSSVRMVRVDENGLFDTSARIVYPAGQGNMTIGNMMVLPDSSYLLVTNSFLAGNQYQSYFTCTKFDEGGGIIWEYSYYDTLFTWNLADYRALDATCDSAGNIYISGLFFESDAVNTQDANMIVKLDSSGNIIFVKGWKSNILYPPRSVDYSNIHVYCVADSVTASGHMKPLVAEYDTLFSSTCFPTDTLMHLDKISTVVFSGPFYTGFVSLLNYTPLDDTLIVTPSSNYSHPACIPLWIQEESHDAMKIWPVPATGHVTFSGFDDVNSVRIYNAFSTNILEKKISLELNELTIDISSLAPGIYIVQATGNGKVWRGKVVKE